MTQGDNATKFFRFMLSAWFIFLAYYAIKEFIAPLVCQ